MGDMIGWLACAAYQLANAAPSAKDQYIELRDFPLRCRNYVSVRDPMPFSRVCL